MSDVGKKEVEELHERTFHLLSETFGTFSPKEIEKIYSLMKGGNLDKTADLFYELLQEKKDLRTNLSFFEKVRFFFSH